MNAAARFVRMAAVSAAAILVAPGAMARLDAAHTESASGALTIVLHFDAPVSAHWQREGRELVLALGQPLDGAILDALGPALDGWVREFRFGYDSVLLGLESRVGEQVQMNGNEVRVQLTRRTAAPEPAPQADDDGAGTRLARLRAQLRGERGDLLGARAELERLRRADPEDVQSSVLQAEREQRLGRWRRAVALYDRVLDLEPGASSVVRAKAATLREEGTFLRLGHDLQDVRDADRQNITRIDARMIAGPHSSVELALESRRVRTPSVRRAVGGATGSFKGERQRGGVTLRLDTGQSQLALTAYASDAGPGAGAAWTVHTNAGETALRAELKRPYFDFVETLVGGGYRSVIEAGHQVTWHERWRFGASAALMRYGIDGTSNAADSWGARAGASYRLADQAPYVSIGYRFDTEHVLSLRQRVDSVGALYAPVPVSSREEHVLEMFVSHPVSDYLTVDAVGGYIYDRLNSRGPFADVALRYEPLPTLEIGVRLGRSFTAARGGDSALLRAGVYLLLRM